MQHTTTQSKITVIGQTHQSVFKKSIFVIALGSLGGITILAGIVSLVSAIILLSNVSTPSLAGTILTDAALDIIIGTLIIASSRAFVQGKILAIWRQHPFRQLLQSYNGIRIALYLNGVWIPAYLANAEIQEGMGNLVIFKQRNSIEFGVSKK